MGIGARLKKILDEKEVSIKDLSLMSGVSLNTLYGITKRDNDTVKNDILERISSSLGVPAQYLLGFESKTTIDEEFEFSIKDTDGLLNKIVGEAKKLNTKGKLLCLENLEQLSKNNTLLDTDYMYKSIISKEWDEAILDELYKMLLNNKINKTDYKKATLIQTRKLFIPYIFDDNDEEIYGEEDDKLRTYLMEAKIQLADKVRTGELVYPYGSKEDYFKYLDCFKK